MIFQLHWQSRVLTEMTQFICQGDTDELDDPLAWAESQFIKHKASKPPEWLPMVCWGDHPAMTLEGR